jgi:acyl dehydratase
VHVDPERAAPETAQGRFGQRAVPGWGVAVG